MEYLYQHNFGAGPCILPETVLNQAAAAVKQLDHSGLSVLEISHRSTAFESVIRETESLVRELLDVPEDYSVLFLQGGASLQFAMVPMSFLQGTGKKAAYLDTGYFGAKAMKEAQLFGSVEVVASSADEQYQYIPKGYRIPGDAAYFHYTSNNTIEGTGLVSMPETEIPVVCDMSSDIFSRPIDVRGFALIYAGAQKNMGPAGMTLVIARNSFLDTARHALPSMLDYRVYRDNGSLYNTPPVFSIYTAMLNLRWLKEKGGIAQIYKENIAKAQLLYNEIERNPLFYPIAKWEDRSIMNVTFRMHEPELEKDFLEYAAKAGMVGIRGYRTIGGFRASLYNALPSSSVHALVDCMKAYQYMREKSMPGVTV